MVSFLVRVVRCPVLNRGLQAVMAVVLDSGVSGCLDGGLLCWTVGGDGQLRGGGGGLKASSIVCMYLLASLQQS